MANARSRFDAICDLLAREHETRNAPLYGRPAVNVEGDPILAFHDGGMAFRLHGRAHANALALPGARPWHPLHPDQPSPDWVLVGAAHVSRWERLALEALRCARERAEQGVRAAEAAAPVPDPDQREQQKQALGAKYSELAAKGGPPLRLLR